MDDEDDIEIPDIIEPEVRVFDHYTLVGHRGKDIGIVYTNGREDRCGLFLDVDLRPYPNSEYLMPMSSTSWLVEIDELWFCILGITNLYAKRPVLDEFYAGVLGLINFAVNYARFDALPLPLYDAYKEIEAQKDILGIIDDYDAVCIEMLIRATSAVGNYHTTFPHRYLVHGKGIVPYTTHALDDAVEDKLRYNAKIIDLKGTPS